MNLRGVSTSAADVYDSLVESINNVYDDVMKVGKIKKRKHPMEYDLFHNEPGVVDGPWYVSYFLSFISFLLPSCYLIVT